MWTTAISFSVGKEQTISEGFPKEAILYGGQVMANRLDVTRADLTLANQSGYSVDVVMEVFAEAYNGSAYFRDESTGREYDIVRTFLPNRGSFIQIYGKARDYGKS